MRLFKPENISLVPLYREQRGSYRTQSVEPHFVSENQGFLWYKHIEVCAAYQIPTFTHEGLDVYCNLILYA